MDTTIYDLHTSFYIPAIKRLDFHLSHVRIIGTNHCGELQRTDFKRRELFQYVICRCDYAERVVAGFAHKIQSQYYGGNISVYIEGIAMEYFIAFTKGRYKFNYTITSTSCSVSIFLKYDDSKQYVATTTSHRNHFIAVIKDKIINSIIKYNMGKH